MKTKKEFEVFFEKTVRPRFEELKEISETQKRKYSFKRFGYSFLILFAVSIVLAVLENAHYLPHLVILFMPLTFIYGMICPIALWILRSNAEATILPQYADYVLRSIVNFSANGLNLKSEDGLTLREFNSSELFRQAARHSSSFLIAGNFKGASLKFSGFQASYRIAFQKHYNHLFDGFYGFVKLKKKLNSKLTICSVEFERGIYGNISVNIFGSNLAYTLNNKVKTGNTDFDSMFQVGCDDENQAKAILNTDFRRTLLACCLILPYSICFSIVEDTLYIALPANGLFFNNFLSPFGDTKYAFQFFDLVNVAIGITENIADAMDKT